MALLAWPGKRKKGGLLARRFCFQRCVAILRDAALCAAPQDEGVP
jgi:hypothetical protein